MKKQLICIITALALTLNAGTAGVMAAELPVVGNWTEITTDEQFSATDSASDPVATLDSTSDPSVTEAASLTLQQQLERRQQRAAAAEGEISAFALGDSAAEPFYISNAAQLAELATLVNDGNASFISAYYQLTNDIDLSAYSKGATVDGVEYPRGWKPIGTDSNKFAGTFDGQDHKITNLTIDNSTSFFQGLFGYATGRIQNLGVEDVSVKGDAYVGGVVGWAHGSVSNCYATGSVSGTESVGGVVGYSGSVSNCYATGSVSGTESVGGVVGEAFLLVSNCYATGSVSGTESVGGVVGVASGAVSNCYAIGSVSGTDGVGGVVGFANVEVGNCVALNPSVSGNSEVGAVVGAFRDKTTLTVSSSYYWGKMSVTANGVSVTTPTVGTTALTYDGGLKSGSDSFVWADFAAVVDSNSNPVWTNTTATTLPTLENVDGTQSSTLPVWITDPKTADLYIYTAADLAALATAVNDGTNNYAGKTVRLMNDIDLSAYVKGATVGEATYPNGWTPIGTSEKPFAGTFDGQDHKITNLTIDNSTADFQGLFGYVSKTGKIQNLGVEDASVKGGSAVGGVVGYTYGAVSNCYATGSVSGIGQYVGGVVGAAEGAVNNCYATGSVSGIGKYVGGVVGYTYGAVSNCYATGSVSGDSDVGGVVGYAHQGSVSNCYATGSVSGTGDFVGGVIGWSNAVSNCYATGTVSGYNGVGGVVGYTESTVSDCYATGSVSGSIGVGGVVGVAEGAVSNCYATGSVSGTEYVGGVVGAAEGAVSNCVALNPFVNGNSNIEALVGSGAASSSYYWGKMSVTENGVSVTTPTVGTTALTYDGGLKSGSDSFVWADFAAVVDSNSNPVWTNTTATTLPTLQKVYGTQSSTLPVWITDPNPADLYIYAAADLAKLAVTVNDGTNNYAGKTVRLMNDIDLSAYAVSETYPNGWTPIGTSEKPFAGTFDGQDHKITNLTIDNSTAHHQGLFGYVSAAGLIQNLGVENVSVKGGNRVGGVVGITYGAISSCYATGNVNGVVGNVGGVVGVAVGAVSNCHATGSVSCTGESAGGVVGGAGGAVNNCYATGTVSGNESVGGVVGSASGDVLDCYATGSVTGTRGNVGGVVGWSAGAVSSCYATGSVSGTRQVGGVAGLSYNGSVSDCYATGSVSGTDGVGGVVGFARAETASIAIENCVALNPSVSGDNAVGAVVGATGSASDSGFSVTVANCYHWGGMTGTKLQIPTDGKLIELNGVLMSGSTAFAWTANGFTTDNGWTIPTTPMQLPYLTDTSYRPAMSLASTDVYKTVTLKYPLNSGNLQYSLDNTNWTPYSEDVSISILTGDDFTVYVKRGNDKATFAGSSTEGQWSGTITKNTTLTPRLLDIIYYIAGTTTTEATIALNNLTGISKDVVVVFAIHGANNELLTSYVQKHIFAAGANETIPWAHNLGEVPANIKVFVLESNGLMPLLVQPALLE